MENNELHEYDGIRELDNQLPRWWIQIFYVTIVFSVGYFAYYHFTSLGKSPTEIFDEELELANLMQPKKAIELNAAFFAGKLENKQTIEVGRAAFAQRCQSCHGPTGGGGVGPNLTDKYWIHGSKPEQIGTSIHDGYPAMGMPGWGAIVSPDELVALVAYVVSINGSQPANPKAPQGNLEE